MDEDQWAQTMKYRAEFEARYGEGVIARSQLDLGADGLYFNRATRERYEWFERGVEQVATLVRELHRAGIGYDEYAELYARVAALVGR